MNVILVVIIIIINASHSPNVHARTYDMRDEDGFDYVNMYDRRALHASSQQANDHFHHADGRHRHTGGRHHRFRREFTSFKDDQRNHIVNRTNINYTTHVFHKDTNNIAFVFWKNAHTKVIFILTCNNASTQAHSKLMNKGCHSESNFYRSTNLGASYQDEDVEGTPFQDHKLHSMYISPLDKKFIIVTDYQSKTLFITNDEGETYKKVTPGFAATFVHFHPTLKKTLTAFDNFERTLWLSIDGGNKWIQIMKNVRNYFWNLELGESLYVEKDFSVLESELFSVIVLEIPKSKGGVIAVPTSMKKFLVPDSVFVGGGFAVYQHRIDNKLYIANLKSKISGQVVFNNPVYTKTKKAAIHYIVLSFDNNELVLGALHSDKTVSIYLSDEFGKRLLYLIDNVAIEKFDSTVMSKIPKIDFYRAKGTKNTYIINRLGNGTLISFDKGYNWQTLNYIDRDLNGQKISQYCKPMGCFLNLFIKVDKQYMDFSAPLLSKDSAPGIIMAQGIIGGPMKYRPINSEHRVWISTDGGRTWKMTLERNYGFALLDHGNFLAATRLSFTVKHYLYFSDNLGETWFDSHFTDYHARIAAIITDSTAKTLVINIFGFLHQQLPASEVKGDTWIVWQFNFTNLFSRTCQSTDFVNVPSTTTNDCVLGEKIYYHRTNRFPNNNTAICHTPPNDDKIYTFSKNCQCKATRDFECDNLFVYTPNENGKGFECKALNENMQTINGLCDSDGYHNILSGYRKLHGNKCIGGDEDLLLGKRIKCDVTLPTRIIITASKITVTTGETVHFSMNAHSGSYNTIYTWDFGDNDTLSGNFSATKDVQHVYTVQRQYTVKLIARNSMEKGSYTATTIVIVMDKNYDRALIEYDEPAIANQVTKFQLRQQTLDGSHEPFMKNIHTKFLWSFQDVYQGGIDSIEMSHVFPAVGTYIITVQIVTTVNSKPIDKTIRVFKDAYYIDLRFSDKLDEFNSGSRLWMYDLKEKVKMALAVRYAVGDTDRIIVQQLPGEQIKLRVILCDTNKVTNAREIADKILTDINKKTPFLYGYGKEGIHISSATSGGYLRRKDNVITSDTSKEGGGNSAWAYVFLFIFVIVAVIGGFVFYKYRHRRLCFFSAYGNKNDIMQKKLVFDVDEEYVGTEMSDQN